MNNIKRFSFNRVIVRLFVPLAASLPLQVFADASNGQFLGYSLGSVYETNLKPESYAASGNTVYRAANPVKPADIETVNLLTTAESKTIGFISGFSTFATEAEARELGKHYFSLLHAKYHDWTVGQEIMNKDFEIIEVSLVNEPHEIRLQLNQDETSKQWSFSMTLGWTPGSKEGQAWRNMSRTQHKVAETDEREQLLKNSDTTGL